MTQSCPKIQAEEFRQKQSWKSQNVINRDLLVQLEPKFPYQGLRNGKCVTVQCSASRESKETIKSRKSNVEEECRERTFMCNQTNCFYCGEAQSAYGSESGWSHHTQRQDSTANQIAFYAVYQHTARAFPPHPYIYLLYIGWVFGFVFAHKCSAYLFHSLACCFPYLPASSRPVIAYLLRVCR